jgi:uncharacterized membrane protein YfcA
MDITAIYVILGAATAGFVQGLSGFAFGLVAMAFWAWVIEPQLAGPMVVFGSLLGQILAFGSIRRAFDLGRVLPFVLAGLIGIPIGVVLLKNIDQTVFRLFVGAVLVLYCSYSLFVPSAGPIKAGGKIADAAIGFIGGVMGGMGGLSGPAPTLWSALRGWKKDAQRAVYQTFNLVMHAATLVVYAGSGLINLRVGAMFALVAPAMLIPAILGARLYKRFSEIAFRRLLLALLAISGLVLIVSAGRALLTPGHG